jgi:centromere protein J
MPWQNRFAAPDPSVLRGVNSEAVLAEQVLALHNKKPSSTVPKGEANAVGREAAEIAFEKPRERENAEPEEISAEAVDVQLDEFEEANDHRLPKAELLKFSPPRARTAAKPVQTRSNARNPEELPLKGVTMNFEKLLEEKLSKEGGGEPAEGRERPKKEYLKRKTQVSTIPKAKKQETAEQEQPKKPDISSKLDRLNRSAVKLTAGEAYDEDDFEESSEPKPAQPFLKRGDGKLCTHNRPQTPARLKATSMKRSSSTNHVGSRRRSQGSAYEEEESYRQDESQVEVRQDELIKETQRVKAEADRLKHMRADVEIRKRQLEQEMHEFYRKREADLKDREAWKDEELRKMRKDRAALERTAKAPPPPSSKKDREEVEALQQQVMKLLEEIKQKDLRHKLQIDMLRKQVEELKGARYPRIVEPVVEDPDSEEIEDRYQPTKANSAVQSAPKISPPSQPSSKPAAAAVQQSSPKKVSAQKVANDGKVQKEFEDGHREVLFPNGVKREIYPDGYTVVHFTNKDIKQSFPDGKVIYFFAEANTQQTTFPDGQQLFKFANGQTEQHFPDGTKEIKFPDGTVKCIFPDGEEESIFPDGTVQKVDSNGVKYIDFVNGQKDTIFPDGTKIREFTDGRVRKILPDGRVIES